MTEINKPSLPRTVFALGAVSLLMDLSSESIHALLPVFLTATLGAGVAVVGLIDGIAEATASIVKVFSGYFSDRIGRRKPLILLGYAMGALAKPMFALAGAPAVVLAARLFDRTGKGVRGAPRDALIADVTPAEIRGRAFGMRQAMDTAGAFLGPLLAIVLMAAFAGDMRAVFWAASIPAALAVACIIVFVRDGGVGSPAGRPPIRMSDVKQIPAAFWLIVLVGVVFSLARFSEAFLVLKANALGLPPTLTPLVLVATNAVYALGAYPAGALSDRAPARAILGSGLLALGAADLVLAFADGLAACFVGIALWGLHMSLTQGLFTKLVADHAPEGLRGSAFGLFNVFTGLGLLAASVVAGLLWDRFGPLATFCAGAGFAAATSVLLALVPSNPPRERAQA